MVDFFVDILLVFVVFIGFYLGYKRGFVGIIARPVKFAASIAISFGCASAFSESVVVPMIREPATNYVSNFLYENCTGVTAETVADEIPTLLKISAAIFGIDVNEVAEGAEGTVIDAIADKLTLPAVQTVGLVISFVVLLIITSIALSIVLSLIKALFKDGVLGAFNKFLGIVFGVAFFFIAAWALAVLIAFLSNQPTFAESVIFKDFEGGIVYRFFNEYNPIELLLSF